MLLTFFYIVTILLAENMKALVLEKKLKLSLRDIDIPTEVGPDDVKIKMHTVGICGSDIHYYEHGRVDILVNNAGVAKHGEMEEYTDELLDNIMNINVDSVFRMCRSAITPMKKQGGGVILNIGSISGLVSNIPQPQVAYNASKAAVHMMTKSLASDFAKDNIRVNALAPGYFRTEMTSLPKENEHWYPTWDKQTPLNRMGETDEIAPAALFLCSPASSYVTGEVLVIDGGYTAR